MVLKASRTWSAFMCLDPKSAHGTPPIVLDSLRTDGPEWYPGTARTSQHIVHTDGTSSDDDPTAAV